MEAEARTMYDLQARIGGVCSMSWCIGPPPSKKIRGPFFYQFFNDYWLIFVIVNHGDYLYAHTSALR